jgi:hypothetical protein
MKRPTEEWRESASHDRRIVRKSISLRHERPSLANRSETSSVIAMGNILGFGLSYRARIPAVTHSISSGTLQSESK